MRVAHALLAAETDLAGRPLPIALHAQQPVLGDRPAVVADWSNPWSSP